MDLSGALLTEPAAERLLKRQIAEADVRQVLAQPECVQSVRVGRVVAQKLAGKYLVRVFVDIDSTPPEVVTAYRTSQIAKYRRQP
jgi:Domain of unknown function (DUF4258)